MNQRCMLLVLALAAAPVLAEEVVPSSAGMAVPAEATPGTGGDAIAPGEPAGAGTAEAGRTAAVGKPDPDPWERFNRSIFRFNDKLDRYALRPVAKGYQKITPRKLRAGITNFFRNLKTPVVMLNDVLQGKVRNAGHDLSRFFVNSTLGFVGFVDASTRLGIPRHEEDFGQTLGVWGVPNGPYVVLPFLGPSTVRDTGGQGVDVLTDPLSWEFEEVVSGGIWAARVVNTRANLLDVEEIIQGDRYLFLRDLYLQSRDFAVKDGRVESDPFLDDEESGDATDDAAPGAPEDAPAAGADTTNPAAAEGEAEVAPGAVLVQDEAVAPGVAGAAGAEQE